MYVEYTNCAEITVLCYAMCILMNHFAPPIVTPTPLLWQR
jgi:hypothetical protein